MRNILVVTIFVVSLLVSFLGITYSYEYNDSSFPTFELIGSNQLEFELGSKYIEPGVIVIHNDEDISSLVNIDSSSLNMNRVGEYKIKYEIDIDGVKEYIYRSIQVKEYISPEIKLLGEDVIYLYLKDKYIEPGYEVSDNYDTNLEDKVTIINNVDTNKVGEYTIEYRVVDSSGNQTSINRTVIVR